MIVLIGGLLGVVEAFGLSIAEMAVIVGGLFFAAEILGISRSSRTVRRTNTDLLERVTALERINGELTAEIRQKADQLHQLEVQIAVLEERDQGAVLQALAAHDAAATLAASNLTAAITTHEANADRRAMAFVRQHEEAMAVWVDIRDTLLRRGGGVQ